MKYARRGCAWQVLAVAVLLLITSSAARAQEAKPATSPAAQPATPASTQPASAPTAEEEAEEARLTQQLAAEQEAEAQSELESIRQQKDLSEQVTQSGLRPTRATQPSPVLEIEERLALRKVELVALRKQYGERREQVAQRKQEIERATAALREQMAAHTTLTSSARTELAGQFQTRATEQHERAAELWRQAAEETEPRVAEFLRIQRELGEQRAALSDSDPLYARLTALLEQLELLILYQRGSGAALKDQGSAEYVLGDAYEDAAAKLVAYNNRFWIRYANVRMALQILAGAAAGHVALNVLAWLINTLLAFFTRRFQGEYATPTVKRIQTLTRFARSIAKLLVWAVATVSILAQFGIHPGQSAGALGVIGLVLAGMFNQLVIDFVKGIDIAVGGHYFVGDFIEVSGTSGHVLNFTVKYTVLRTPSGQVVTLPNSQCIPSRRFPAGYVDNYVDIPLASSADATRAQTEIERVGHALNARIETIKRAPRVVDTFRGPERTVLRVQIRVLPTCGWVVTDHFLPQLLKRFETLGITLADQPNTLFINDVPTFRRLFSRQMTDRELAATLAAEKKPTIEREALPDDDHPDASDGNEKPPVAADHSHV